MRHTLFATSLALLLSSLAAASPARACWDGYRATTEHVEVTGADDVWSPARARSVALWLARLEALVAPSATRVELGDGWLTVTRRDGSTIDLGAGEWTMPRVFAAVARTLRVDAAARRRAMSATSEVTTVEVGGAMDLVAATRLAALIDERELGEPGFYEAGGFPAENPTAHVLGGRGSNAPGRARVVVGAFLDRAAAERVAARIGQALSLPVRVRPL